MASSTKPEVHTDIAIPPQDDRVAATAGKTCSEKFAKFERVIPDKLADTQTDKRYMLAPYNTPFLYQVR